MKHVQACLSAKQNRESSFHFCGGPVSLVQASFCEGNPDKAVLTVVDEL